MRLVQIGDIDLTEDMGATVETVRGALLLATPEELRKLAPLLFGDVVVSAAEPDPEPSDT